MTSHIKSIVDDTKSDSIKSFKLFKIYDGITSSSVFKIPSLPAAISSNNLITNSFFSNPEKCPKSSIIKINYLNRSIASFISTFSFLI